MNFVAITESLISIENKKRKNAKKLKVMQI